MLFQIPVWAIIKCVNLARHHIETLHIAEHPRIEIEPDRPAIRGGYGGSRGDVDAGFPPAPSFGFETALFAVAKGRSGTCLNFIQEQIL